MRDPLSLHIALERRWETIEVVRHGVTGLVQAATHDRDLAAGVSTACAELLENAMKYGTEQAVELDLKIDASGLTLRVSNGFVPGSPHIASLKERLELVRGYEVSEEAFVALLGELFTRPESSGASSGLGLARVRHECQCELDCEIDDRVTVVVKRPWKVTK